MCDPLEYWAVNRLLGLIMHLYKQNIFIYWPVTKPFNKLLLSTFVLYSAETKIYIYSVLKSKIF